MSAQQYRAWRSHHCSKSSVNTSGNRGYLFHISISANGIALQYGMPTQPY